MSTTYSCGNGFVSGLSHCASSSFIAFGDIASALGA